jgi:SpoVK/Ycf46/Vps4 family AAA+-type ATPase
MDFIGKTSLFGAVELVSLAMSALEHEPPLVGGILLHGPTGVGKSSLISSVLDKLPPVVSKHHLDCTSIFSKHVGGAEAKLVHFFDVLDKSAPCVCMVEDLEGLGRRGHTGVTSRRMLALICCLIDSLRARRRKVLLIASCRDPGRMEPCLCASGRFDVLFPVVPPDLEDRIAILRHLTKRMFHLTNTHKSNSPLNFSMDATVEAVALRTHGFVVADLVRLCREAAMNAAHSSLNILKDARSVTLADFERALVGPHAEPSSLRADSHSGAAADASHIPQDPAVAPGSKEIISLGGQLQREWSRLEVSVVAPLAAAAAAHAGRSGTRSNPSSTLRSNSENSGVDKTQWRCMDPTAALLGALGVGSPRGVLIAGPPGTGKTALALATARAVVPLGVRFLSVGCNSLVRAEVGSSEKALASVFASARRASPCLVLLDQIDVIAGRRRVAGVGGGDASSSSSTENTMDRLLSLLLVEMDGVLTTAVGGGVNGVVVLIATTQDASLLEPALLRPGRLDQHILLSPSPSLTDRADILRRLLSTMPLDLEDGGKGLDSVALVAPAPGPHSESTPQTATDEFESLVAWLAHSTQGMAGAELEQLCQEAAIECLRCSASALGVRKEHFSVALAPDSCPTPIF